MIKVSDQETSINISGVLDEIPKFCITIMSTLYITEQGSTLAKHSRRLIVYKNGAKITEFPIINVDRVMLFGNIQVTAQAVAFLLDSGIDLCYITSRGRDRKSVV